MELKPGQIWRHYKGGMYRIVALPQNNQTDELYDSVVYEDISDTSKIWVQSKERFLGKEDWQGETVARFTLVSDN